MPPIVKRVSYWLGGALSVGGLIFVVHRLFSSGTVIDLARFGPEHWLAMVGLGLVYGAAYCLLALAWRQLLEQFGASTSLRWALQAYGLSQIAKYLPGNIFHLAGRQALGMAAGVGAWPLAKSSLWELGLIAVTGGFFGWLVLPVLAPGVPVLLVIALWALTLAAATLLLARFGGRPLARAFGYQAAFLTASGAIFVALMQVGATGPGLDIGLWPLVAGTYVVAWLAGLVTPGSPAGIGVRELVIVFMLRGVASEADVLIAVMAGRLVTVIGDVLFFGVAAVMAAREAGPAAPAADPDPPA